MLVNNYIFVHTQPEDDCMSDKICSCFNSI